MDPKPKPKRKATMMNLQADRQAASQISELISKINRTQSDNMKAKYGREIRKLIHELDMRGRHYTGGTFDLSNNNFYPVELILTEGEQAELEAREARMAVRLKEIRIERRHQELESLKAKYRTRLEDMQRTIAYELQKLDDPTQHRYITPQPYRSSAGKDLEIISAQIEAMQDLFIAFEGDKDEF